MKKYCSPMAEIYDLAKEDIMSISGTLSLDETKEGGEGATLGFSDFNMNA